MVNPNIPRRMGNRRPLSSDKGAHITGPVAKPRTYSERPRTPTSAETWYLEATLVVAAEKILLAKEAMSVVQPSINDVAILNRSVSEGFVFSYDLGVTGLGILTSFWQTSSAGAEGHQDHRIPRHTLPSLAEAADMASRHQTLAEALDASKNGS